MNDAELTLANEFRWATRRLVDDRIYERAFLAGAGAVIYILLEKFGDDIPEPLATVAAEYDSADKRLMASPLGRAFDP